MSILATDNFNRADEVPVNAPWVTGAGNLYWKISIEEFVRGDSDFLGWAYYDGSISWPNNQYSKAKVTYTGAGVANDQGVGLSVRKASGQTDTMYRVILNHEATNNVALHYVNASTVNVITRFTQAWNDGDTWEIHAVGTTLSVWLNSSQVGTNQTDGNLTAGFPGTSFAGPSSTLGKVDDWEGGDISGGGNSVSLDCTNTLPNLTIA